jgi:hypothetical protein
VRRLRWIAESLAKYCVVFVVVVAVSAMVAAAVPGTGGGHDWGLVLDMALGGLVYVAWIPLAVVFLAHVVTLATGWRFHPVLCAMLLPPLLFLFFYPPAIVVGFFVNGIFIAVSREMPPADGKARLTPSGRE